MAAAQRYPASLDDDPTLAHFDLLVLHLDADVALKDYEDCGPDVMRLAAAQGWKTLPCAKACPPASDTCDEIGQAIRSWLAPATVGNRTVVCVPAQSSGTWLAAAALPAGHALLAGVECNPAVESRLETLPLKLRIRKSAREYQTRAVKITREWAKVKSLCSQAEAFEQAVQAVA
jgi:aminoglycoside phosphotransferase